ncbi:hypothetical protein Bca52824_036803 [Brassica carinata]|uniref:Uncharacterized protein n=1 Tax=Brassica carinata TaxID=52824 RepID=A0A8X7V450_BRACI|nr:hypothetical protein Bca52824_036803 [Brassica carinata]
MAMKSVQNSGKSRYLADNNHQAGSYIWRERTFERECDGEHKRESVENQALFDVIRSGSKAFANYLKPTISLQPGPIKCLKKNKRDLRTT